MKDENLELKRLAKLFNTESIVDSEDIEQLLTGISRLLESFKKQTLDLNSDTKNSVDKMLRKITEDRADLVKQITNNKAIIKGELSEEFSEKIENVKRLAREVMEMKPKDGVSPKIEDVVSLVVEKLRLPDAKIALDGAEVKKALGTLVGPARITADMIDGLDTYIDKRVQLHAPQGMRNTIGGGVTQLKAGANITIESTGSNGRGVVTISASSSGIADGDKGDVTVSDTGETWTIDNGVVTLAKMADMATGSLIYRKTAGSGAPEVNTLATLKTDLGLSGTNTGDQTSVTGNAGTATALQNARTIGGVSFDGTANITVATATGGFTISGGDLALGANNITMTGSIGTTGSRITKLWATDLQVTNAIAGSVTGNAATATALATPRAINGTNFDGTAAITVTAAAGTLTGTVLNATVVTSSLTAVGTIGTGIWQGTVINSTYGGTGVNNGGRTITLNTGNIVIAPPAGGATITLANNLTTAGNFALTLTQTGTTNVTLPTTGTLATITGAEELTNKTLNASVGKGTWTASGTWTLPAFTLGGVVTMGENTEILLDAALSADGKYCGITEDGTAGEALAFGDLVYFKAADSRWWLADADADATSGAVKLAMVVLAAGSGGSATKVLLYGKIRADAAFPALTIGAPAYAGTTAGDIQTAQPSGTDDVIRIIGYGNTADELFFCPSPDYMTHV